MSTATSQKILEPNDPRLLSFFELSYKKRDDWKIGIECEVSGVFKKDLSPIPFYGETSIEWLMKRFREHFDNPPATWEDGFCFGMKLKQGNISLEPGGQIEFSSNPFTTVEEQEQALNIFFDALSIFAKERELIFYIAGVNPFQKQEEMPWSPKYRYKIMRSYLGKKGKHAHKMMQQTMSIQYNIDFSDQKDGLRKYHAARILQPMLLALTSNSSVYEQKALESPFRTEIWENMDPDRSGLPPVILNFQEYIDYALDVPMFFIEKEGEWLALEGAVTFRQYLEQGWQEHKATYEDWELHLSTLFPEVRFKKNALELRMFDGVESKYILALGALIKGIFHNDEALEQVLSNSWPIDWNAFQKLIVLAASFLQEQEQKYLQPLRELCDEKKTPGEQAVAFYLKHDQDPKQLLKYLTVAPS